jgi:hypothetical protein
MDVNRSPKPYAIAGLAILGVTVIGLIVVSSDKEEPVEHVEALDDVLNKAVISAVTAIEVPDVGTDTQTANQATQAAQEIQDMAKTVLGSSPSDPAVREDAVMADPGPDWVASVPESPAEDAGVPEDEEPHGTLEREVIRDGIQAMRPVVESCYLETLADFPDAEGRVTLAFTIAAENDEGRVELAELDGEKSTLIDAMLHDCMLKALGDLKFPAPEGNGKVNVRYPFNFSPK